MQVAAFEDLTSSERNGAPVKNAPPYPCEYVSNVWWATARLLVAKGGARRIIEIVHSPQVCAELRQAVVGCVAHKPAHEAQILEVVTPDIGAVIDDECHRRIAHDAVEALVRPALRLSPTGDAP